MLRRGGIWTVRVQVLVDLRPLIGRRDLWRSVGTACRRKARLRAAVFRGHKGPRFVRLQREHRRMSRQRLEALLGEYLEAELWESQTRLATGAWDAVINDHGEQGDWNDVAQMLLGEEVEKLADALQYNRLDIELPRAVAMLPDVDEEDRRVLARRLLEARMQALQAELRGLQGESFSETTDADATR